MYIYFFSKNTFRLKVFFFKTMPNGLLNFIWMVTWKFSAADISVFFSNVLLEFKLNVQNLEAGFTFW